MPSKKPPQTLADYVTIALSPLLIMALIGSLVFFLLEVVYVGQYSGRLQWTLFFFVFGMVLIARISIEQGGGRAGLYGLLLAGVTFLALQAFFEYDGTALAAFSWAINLGLIALICWCAYRLTWDCTHIDEAVDASGKGVLEAAGLDNASGATEAPEDTGASAEEATKPIKGQPSLLAWWDRYQRYREEQRRKPHTPGVWVVYFSLAALPLFGLGQALIPVEEDDRRRYVFWLMVSYVGSGLGLLLTTSFLGLRRYLRQRKLQMPAAMTGVWLAVGGSLIVLFLLVGALLPRPYGEYQLTDFTPLGSKERSASRYAIKRDSAGKGEGQSSTDPAKDEQRPESGSGNKPDSKEGARSRSQGKQGDQSSGKNGKAGDQKGSKSDGRSANQKNQPDNQRDGDKNRDPESRQRDEQAKDRQDQQKNEGGGGRSSSQDSSQKKSEADSSTSAKRSSSSNPVLTFLSKLGTVATVLKWIVFGLLAVAVVFFLLRSGLQFLANFTDWAKRLLAWWQGLFARSKAPVGSPADEDELARIAPPRPFASFHNPFVDGRAEQLSPDELARYSFEALQSWAWERELGRQPEETPLEFAERLVVEVPALEADARRLASLYARVAYARGSLTRGCLGTLRQFWQRLDSLDEKPVSA